LTPRHTLRPAYLRLYLTWCGAVNCRDAPLADMSSCSKVKYKQAISINNFAERGR
jgi:hypothetical protein